MKKFSDLALLPEIQQSLQKMGFDTPTDIQDKAIPLLIDKSIDFHGQAQTGTGKTLAFGIPLLQTIIRSNANVQALVVAPTRELVTQIHQSLLEAAQCMPDVTIAPIYGGVSITNQIKQLRNGVHIVIGTPGRLNDHLKRRTLKLNNLKTIVLDEADIMLDMGFKEEIEEILQHAAPDRKIWLFSATVKTGIKSLMKSHMNNPLSIRVSQKNVGSTQTEQFFTIVPKRDRIAALKRFIDVAPEFYGFVFCRTKLLTAEVSERLTKAGYHALALHGDMNQAQRNKVIKQFKNKEFPILVATDVAARGIDVPDATHVINFSFPEDHENYVHRIGRTGRAGKTGIAITFINRNELRLIAMVNRKFNVEVKPLDVPNTNDIVKVKIGHAQQYLNTVSGNGIEKNTNEELRSLVEEIPQTKLVNIVVKLLHDSYFKSNEIAISFPQTTNVSLHDADHELQEIYLNVGSDDGISKSDIFSYIKKQTGISSDKFQKVKLIKRRCYLVAVGSVITELLNKIGRQKLGGRRVLAFLSDDFKSQPVKRPRGRHKRFSRNKRPRFAYN